MQHIGGLFQLFVMQIIASLCKMPVYGFQTGLNSHQKNGKCGKTAAY